MDGAKGGITGGVPQLNVKPVDQNLPVCGVPIPGGKLATCTRKKGHYGYHGYIMQDGTVASWAAGKEDGDDQC